ncbi:MAG: glycoside hydrolase family 88 protein [Paludibacteraceae bacterium]|nr:glycoside hydrolase family 88 protein [Paludibacteraceae bacterium]
MKNRLIILLTIVFALLSCSSEPELTRKDYLAFASCLSRSQMAHNPELWQSDYVKKPKWDYTQGIIANAMLEVYLQTGNNSLLQYVQHFADYFILPDGNIQVYDQQKYNIDHVAGGNFLFTLDQIASKPEYQKAIALLRQQLLTQPRTSEGGFWHKKVYPHQMWLDGLYMGEPFYARYAAAYNQPELFDDIALQFLTVDRHTCDPRTGLNYHGWDESREQQWADSLTGCSPNFWSRSIGWYEMALVDVLELMPADHPQRNALLQIFQRVSKALLNYQDKQTGMWRQLTVFPVGNGNYLESTASAMFCYAFAKGARLGLLPEKYLHYARHTFNGMRRTVIRQNPDSTVSLTQCCAVAGLGGKPYRDGTYRYYVSEPVRDDDPKGIGPLIMATLELAKCKADIIVAKDGSGDFRTIQEAVNAVPDYRKSRTLIRIKPGVYCEKLIIPASKEHLSIIGDNASSCILTFSDYAKLPSPLFPDETLGTSGSATLYTAADDLYVENLTICNAAGEGKYISQAVAAHVSGKRVVFRRCRFLGNQDTLYTYEKGSLQWYDQCYIEGTTDFIFGWSTAVFTACHIHSKKNSYVTAASTPEGQSSGYTFFYCDLTADPEVTQVYLGRPWRPYAQTVFIRCRLGKHIRPEGWHNWNKPHVEKTAFYAEYQNTGEGANTDQRVSWAHILSDSQAEAYTPYSLLHPTD